ncbi:hypothetical protein DNH61_02305 [Paenibacillus sambharensis]|uniref:Uncharacterized protein n=1 Tax=Paenibacillus sambharensis TaxID=1803190 RepID=A0A2W1LR87_9BACL|nr:hypothetical protein [Paenibacillus sambharensis]PZD97472.1 hypothetical protein DNH61_02305 [Paenibacillus sambharensis]
MERISIWTLKKLPLDDIVDYIQLHGSTDLQARIAEVSLDDYIRMTAAQGADRIKQQIAVIPEEKYDEFLLELIDE